ncbi:MAG: HPr family phosphocarrier protein [Gammaproteobacteria bacterium]|nr:HPr family phosphocarrier protein [Gammaproteobacteria bacterium]
MKREREIEVVNKLGLHARAAAKLVSTANGFASQVRLHCEEREADAKSIMSVMMLAAAKGTHVTVATEGDDAETALSAVTELFADKFGEEE